jgi:aspartate-semialdehyde dehydrogenase
VAIVGASLELASDLFALLIDRGIAADRIHVLDREETAGETLEVDDIRHRVEWATPDAVAAADVAIFCGSPELAREIVPTLRVRGRIAIDATGASRSDREVPLVVPEVNGDRIGPLAPGSVIASPAPPVVGLVLALAPLRRAAGLERALVTILEPASRRGGPAIEELSRQAIQLMQGQGLDRDEFAEQLAFNLRPEAPESEGGWSGAEADVAEDVARILDAPGLGIAATVVRVPVFFGSAQAVHADLAREISLADAESALRAAPALLLAGSVEDRVAVAVEAARRRKERAALHAEEDDRDVEEELAEDGLEIEDELEDDERDRDEYEEDPDEAYERRERARRREEQRRARASAEATEAEEHPDLLPGPVDVSGSAFVHVARLRFDPMRPQSLALWIAFDEIRRGIAMNAVGILELVLRARG